MKKGERDVPLRPVTTGEGLREALAAIADQGRTLALVPTMGSLHEGHLRLVDEARKRADAVAMTIFVNPLQFEPGEDLDRYPRDLDRDLRLASERGVDLVFAPSAGEMYPQGPPSVRVEPGPMGRRLCGAFRPHHFGGVLTVVARLFGLFRPRVAVFGRKDYQQWVLVARMARDLAYPVEVRVGPLVRERDGLALSTRNAYLSEEERSEAVGLYHALSSASATFQKGETDSAALLSIAHDELRRFPALRVQYLELVGPDDLEPLVEARSGAILAVAAFCGDSRLIDNVILGAIEPDPVVSSPRGWGGSREGAQG